MDPAVLWFINTTGCYRRLAFACFISNSFFTRQITHAYCDNCIYDEWDEIDLVVLVFERHNITTRHYLQYLTTTKYIQTAKIQRTTGLTQRQQREKTSMLDQDACKAVLTDFAISKWPRGIDELMFFSVLR